MKRSLIIYLLFILLTTHFTMGIAPPDNTISFEWQGHLIVVKGNINGSQDDYNFIIDTGALTFIDKNVAQELQLKQKGMMAKINSLELSGFHIDDIFCFTTFDPVPQKTVIYHHWFHRDRPSAKVKLTLKPPRWSSYSSIQLRAEDIGPWRVEIADSQGRIFHVLRFSITE